MNRKSAKGALVLGVLLLALAVATSSYAKLVVLSFGFDNSTEGFSSSLNATGSCTNSITTSQSNGALQVVIGGGSCANGQVIITKLVVLSSSISQPSVDMKIKDVDGVLDLTHVRATLSSVSNPDAKIVVLGSNSIAGGWSNVSGAWGASAASGNATLQFTIPLNTGNWSGEKHIAVDFVNLNNEAQ